jgi:DNA-binding beta-propeller fold protein YncE
MPLISRAVFEGKRSILLAAIPLVLFAVAAYSRQSSAIPKPNPRALYQQAAEACKARDYRACVDKMRQAVELVPDYPRLIYGLGAANALAGNRTAAVSCLTQLAAMGLVYDPATDPSFASLKNSTEFQNVTSTFQKNKAPIVASSKAFAIHEMGLVPEGLAYDPVTETFYVGSIHKRKIIAVDKLGQTRTFAGEGDGLWSVLGMTVDAKRRILWATTTAFPQMIDFKSDQDGLSAVLKFDLSTKRLVKKYVLGNQKAKHALGDLTINSQGDVFTTDSLTPAVYKIDHQRDEIESFLESDDFASPQGLALSPDEQHLFMADYARGIFDITLATKPVVRFEPVAAGTMLGIDGLYFYKGSLIGVQNGVSPNRVVRIYLSADLRRAERFEVIESNNPLFDEPTLGALVGDTFNFIANSQWRLVNEKGELGPEGELRYPLILKIELPKGN